MESFGDQRRKSYYAVLGLRTGASHAEIRSAYKKLVMKWHPDRWSKKDGVVAEEAKRRFQEIQQAYQVLSDQKKRTLYDVGLYDDEDEEEEVEGLGGFVQEMLGLMADVRREGRSYSLSELGQMLQDMSEGFEQPSLTTARRGTTPCKRRQTAAGGYAAFDAAGGFGRTGRCTA